jgi:REP-associated tyrosine transposase
LRRLAVLWEGDEGVPEGFAHGLPVPLPLRVHLKVPQAKYRKPILRGEVGLAVRELVREVCKAYDVEILKAYDIEIVKGHVRPDHLHLLLSVPPTMAPSRVMNAIKGRSSNRLMRKFREFNRQFWGRHLWSRGYFVATSGNVTDDVLKRYIEDQDVEPQNDDFKVTE